jgi:hypothetical protein
MWNSFAFPSSPDKYEPEFGLTKRELIAAMAMQGMLADPDIHERFEVIADEAVQAADALIERLNADPVAGGGKDAN